VPVSGVGHRAGTDPILVSHGQVIPRTASIMAGCVRAKRSAESCGASLRNVAEQFIMDSFGPSSMHRARLRYGWGNKNSSGS